MQVKINDQEIFIPSTLAEYKLCQRILFQKEQGDLLDMMLKSILEMPDNFERELGLSQLQLEICYRGFSFWSGIDVEVLRESNKTADICAIYLGSAGRINEYVQPQLQPAYAWNADMWYLPNPELKRGTNVTFGEFIDSKSLIKDNINAGRNKWESLAQLAAIYLRKENEPYQESFLFEDSERLKLMADLPLSIALHVAAFFDQFSDYIDKYFPVFHAGRGKSGKHMNQHFDRWGWINFLKSISKTKEFDIQGSGKNSIQCAREANLFDVLLYASESKEYNEAQNADFEAEKKRT